jgi:hypothetical protein
MMGRKRYVSYCFQTCFLKQLIPLVHQLQFLRVYNNEDGIVIEAGET